MKKKKQLDKSDFNWQSTIQYLNTLPNVKTKIEYLLHQKAEYEQSPGFDLNWDEPTFGEKCKIEMKKLKDLAELEQQGQIPKSPFKLSEKRGSKTDIIRILNALYGLNLIQLENGQLPTKQQFIQLMGELLGVDMEGYEQVLSKALEQSLEANLEVFEKMKMTFQEQVLARQEKVRN